MGIYAKLQIAAAVTEAGLLMKDNGSGKLTPTDAVDDTALGVYVGTGSADDFASLEMGGEVVKMRASGAITLGATLVPSAVVGDEGYVKVTAATGDAIIGKALQVAADQDTFYALLYDYKDAVTA